MSFSNREPRPQNDNVPSFAHLELLNEQTTGRYYYRIEKRRVISHRPANEWLEEKTEYPSLVANYIRNAVDYADVPVRRSE